MNPSASTSSPTRIDLAGGTLDLWPLHHMISDKATVNLAISLRSEVEVESTSDNLFEFISEDQNISWKGSFEELSTVKELKAISLCAKHLWGKNLGGLKIKTLSRSPFGAGIGGSSSLMISIISAIWTLKSKVLKEEMKPFSEQSLVDCAKDLEASLIHIPTGIQDYWAAVRGGANVISYEFGKTEIKTLDPSLLKKLEERIILAFSGQSRASANNNWDIFKNVIEKNEPTFSLFQKLGEISKKCAKALQSQNIEETLHWSEEEWNLRNQLCPMINTPQTQAVTNLAKEFGANFSRVCGAGGGGVICILVPKEKKQTIINKLTEQQVKILDATLDPVGISCV